MRSRHSWHRFSRTALRTPDAGTIAAPPPPVTRAIIGLKFLQLPGPLGWLFLVSSPKGEGQMRAHAVRCVVLVIVAFLAASRVEAQAPTCRIRSLATPTSMDGF